MISGSFIMKEKLIISLLLFLEYVIQICNSGKHFIHSFIHLFNKYFKILYYKSKAWLFYSNLQKIFVEQMPHCMRCYDLLYLAVSIYKHFSVWPMKGKLFTIFSEIISSEMWQRKWANVTHRTWEASNENHCNSASILRHYTSVII